MVEEKVVEKVAEKVDNVKEKVEVNVEEKEKLGDVKIKVAEELEVTKE